MRPRSESHWPCKEIQREPMGVGGGNGRSPTGKEKKNGYKKEGEGGGGEYTTGGNRGRGRL